MPKTTITLENECTFKRGEIIVTGFGVPLRIVSYNNHTITVKRGWWTWIKYYWITFWCGPINRTLFGDYHA